MANGLRTPVTQASPRAYPLALLMVAASTLVGLTMAPRWGTSAVDLIYLPTVLVVAALGGLGPALVAAIGSALAYNYFFTAPYHTLRIHSPADVVTVVVLFLVAVVTSHLAAGIRKQAQIAQAHADRNATIAGLARRLLSCTSAEQIAGVAVKELADLFQCNAVLVNGVPDLHLVAAQPPTIKLNPSDLGAVAQVLAHGQALGRGITAVTTVEWQFHPISSGSLPIAAVGLARDDGTPPVDPERLSLLGNLLDQIALAFERARLETETREFTALRERDQVRSTLLASIGRDLKPAIAAISAGAGDLRRSGSADKTTVSNIFSQAANVQRYLSNLLDLSPEADQRPVQIGGVTIDLYRRTVSREGKDVHLTPKEYAVLAELAKHPGRVLTHAHLLRTAWGPAQERQTEYLRVAIRALRQKLETDPTRPTVIINEPAVGYRLSS